MTNTYIDTLLDSINEGIIDKAKNKLKIMKIKQKIKGAENYKNIIRKQMKKNCRKYKKDANAMMLCIGKHKSLIGRVDDLIKQKQNEIEKLRS